MSSSFRRRPPVAADVAAVAELVIAYEASIYGETAYSLDDLRAEWEDLDLARDALVFLDGERIVGYTTLQDRGELWRADAYVHPDVRGRGLGTELVEALEATAASRGAKRIQNGVVEQDEAGHRLVAELGYRPVRVFRELRVGLDDPPAHPEWPGELGPGEFVAERDAAAFHAAQQEAFADHWEFHPLDLGRWRAAHVESEGFDPSLWCVVRSGDEVVAGAICEANRYGGGWVAVLFTRRPWRGQGLGRAMLRDSFRKFRERGEPSAGLSVDAENTTGAFHLYESVGMKSQMGWVMHEKEL